MSGFVFEWQEQVDRAGCGIASLAMLLGVSYARIVELAPQLCGARCGVTDDEMDHFLASCGYAVQRLHPFKTFDGIARQKWPPKPWSERHLVSVIQTKHDHVGHFVVMNRRGVVYDPADREFVPSRLGRYHRVEWVAGVYPIA